MLSTDDVDWIEVEIAYRGFERDLHKIKASAWRCAVRVGESSLLVRRQFYFVWYCAPKNTTSPPVADIFMCRIGKVNAQIES